MAAQLEGARPDKGAASRRTLQLITVLVPAIAGVLGTFITVLPQMRNKDFAIVELKQKLDRLEQFKISNSLVSDSQGKAAADAAKRLNIKGTITDPSGQRALGGLEVFLVPQQNTPKFIGQTKPDGSFRFPDMPDQRYRIGVRNANGTTLGEMDTDNDETDLDGAVRAKVRYQVEK